jgi:hypothetical protein
LRDGHKPDIISYHAEKYRAYVFALYRSLGGKDPEGNLVLKSLLGTASRLPNSHGNDQDGDLAREASALRALAQQFGLTSTYNPIVPMAIRGDRPKPDPASARRVMDELSDSYKTFVPMHPYIPGGSGNAPIIDPADGL